jgi:hypothetical protein
MLLRKAMTALRDSYSWKTLSLESLCSVEKRSASWRWSLVDVSESELRIVGRRFLTIDMTSAGAVVSHGPTFFQSLWTENRLEE